MKDETGMAGHHLRQGDGPARYGRGVVVTGLVLVRQRPGSAKGVISLTQDDETVIGSLVIWQKATRIVLGAGVLGVTSRA